MTSKFVKLYTPLALACVAVLQGCAVTPPSKEPGVITKQVNARAAELDNIVKTPTMVQSNEMYVPVAIRHKGTNKAATSGSGWLKSIQVDINVGSQPMSLAELLRLISKQGVNITSELSLDKFYYSGFSFSGIDAETALKAILASVSLDYTVDNASKIVTIKPLGTKTWYLNTGNRTSEYNSNGAGTKGNMSQTASLQAAGSSTVSSKDNFWDSLNKELEQRTQVSVMNSATKAVTNSTGAITAVPAIVPGAPLAPAANGQAVAGDAQGQQGNTVTLPPPGASSVVAANALPGLLKPGAATQAPASNGQEAAVKYDKIAIATYAINPETGAISVQGPSWLLADLDTYFKKIQEMYNTDIVFEGELLMLTKENATSEGFNISSFASFAQKRYGVILDTNTSGGGVTVSIPRNNTYLAYEADGTTPNMLSWIPSVASTGLSAPMLGVQSLIDGLQIFNNYLSTLGSVTSIQKPIITTTSGVPADFRKTITRYYNSVSQTVAGGGTGSAAVGTQNSLVGQEFGTVLRVNPRFDTSSGLIRAQIELVQTTMAGTQQIPQAVSAGSNIVQVTTSVPIPSKVLYSGEALLKDGDMIIMGGQSEDSQTEGRNGITGLMDVKGVSGLFGTGQKAQSQSVFYFALKATVHKKK